MGILHRSYAPHDLDGVERRNTDLRGVRIQTELRKESEGQILACSAGGWGSVMQPRVVSRGHDRSTHYTSLVSELMTESLVGTVFAAAIAQWIACWELTGTSSDATLNDAGSAAGVTDAPSRGNREHEAREVSGAPSAGKNVIVEDGHTRRARIHTTRVTVPQCHYYVTNKNTS